MKKLSLIPLLLCFLFWGQSSNAQIVVSSNVKLPSKKKSSVTGQKYKEKDWNRILAVTKYPAYQSDKQTLTGIREDFKYLPAIGEKHQQILARRREARTQLDAIKARYEEAWTLSVDEPADDRGTIERLYKDARARSDSYFAELNKICPDPVAMARDEAESYRKLVAALKEGRSPADEKVSVSNDLSIFEFCIAVARLDHAADSPEVRSIEKFGREAAELKAESGPLFAQYEKEQAAALAAQREKEGAEREKARRFEHEKKAYEKAKNREAPQEGYAGRDAAGLKARIRMHWAADKECGADYEILKVYLIDKDWKRKSGYKQVGENFAKYDYEHLWVGVAVQPKNATGSELAYMVFYNLKLDHLNNGKYDYLNFSCGATLSTPILKAKIQ